MARIRTVKPEFFTSLSNGALSRDARLLYIGLYTYCDDEGRGVHDARVIKGALFPLDDDMTHESVTLLISELHRAGKVILYEVDGKPLLRVAGWHHQKISHPTPSRLPPEDSGKVLEPSRKSRRSRARAVSVSVSGNREQGRANGCAPEHPPERNGEGPPPAGPAELVSNFDRFWDACPRKIGKARARAKFDSATRRGVPPEQLIDAMTRAAATWTRAHTEERFIPHPATWLEQGRWDDEDSTLTKPAAARIECARCQLTFTSEPVCFQDGCPLTKAAADV